MCVRVRLLLTLKPCERIKNVDRLKEFRTQTQWKDWEPRQCVKIGTVSENSAVWETWTRPSICQSTTNEGERHLTCRRDLTDRPRLTNHHAEKCQDEPTWVRERKTFRTRRDRQLLVDLTSVGSGTVPTYAIRMFSKSIAGTSPAQQ